jgi:hypothetical protein
VNERKRRIGENEAIFRSVNEQAHALEATFSPATGTMRIVCECGAPSCTEQITIEPEEYVRVRADSTLFALKPGHDLPETERVVSKHDGYWIVQKHPGLPASIARATDPNA